MWIIARGDESLILWWRIEYLEICLEHKFSTPGKRCEKNYSSVRRYVADPVNAYPKRSITKLILKGAVIFDVVSYQFRCALNYSKLLNLDAAFEQKNEIAKAVEAELEKKRNPDRERRQGRCPLTPEEVGLMLRALRYSSDVHIYVALGEVYGGEDTLSPLKALFLNIHSKDTIATKEEMTPFLSWSARMAALDFIVCDESDVFVTNNNGNMAKMLAGRRKYFGHKPTIRPNDNKLWRLFVDRNNMTWEEFSTTTRGYQVGFMGQPNEVKPGTGEFHENPVACICENSDPMSESMIHSNHFFESDETNYVMDKEHVGFDDEDVDNENMTWF
ncbi:O-fucosyltransferase 6-like protein [Tanacetum coccineum]|uniref:O-fucosyltransferase family protein n=1 Tax=Tanacetum coccineum TaxID=301880 RepID=A0ABQ5BZA4_9ASTR